MKNSDTTYQNNRLARTLVSLIGVIVPANQRSIWREEWLSELECSPRPETGNARTKNVVLGTFRHALTLRLLDLETIHQDITFSIRGLFKRPVFAITGITTLGLGIGAVTAVFALVDHVLIRPLPYPDSHELYTLFETDSTAAIRLASYPTFSDWHEENDSFDGMAYVHGNMLRLVTDVGSSLLLTSFITDEFFETLGTSPVIGRVFDSEDYNTGRRVVILSHGTWQTHFAGSSNIIGSSVILSEEAYTIVGVMPPWFEFPNWGVADTDLWVPFTNLPPGDLAAANQRGFHADSRIIARLPSTTSLDKASDEMAAVARGLAELYPAEQRGWTNVEIRRLRDWVLGDSTSRITMLVAVVVLLMLITSANLVNLLLAQGASRAREFAIRKALGADRSRILRQLFIEALVLSAAGAGLGVLMAIWGVNLMQRMMPRLPRIEEVAVDGETLVFAALLGLITTILVGFLPATRFTRQDLTPALRASVGISHSAHGTGRIRNGIVIAELALTTMLVISTGLLIKSFWRLSNVDPGFDPRNLVSYPITPPSPKYDDPNQVVALYTRLIDAAENLPGVDAAGLINHLPFRGSWIVTDARVGQAGNEQDRRVLFRTVTPGYFQLMGIPIKEGRAFTAADVTGYNGAVVINETLARAWGEQSPLGGAMSVLKAAKERPDFGEPIVGTVTGVVGDVKHLALTDMGVPVVYVPYNANPWSHMNLVVKTTGDPASMLLALEAAILAVDPAIPVSDERMNGQTMQHLIYRSLGEQRFYLGLVAAMAGLALALASIGLYGVISYLVNLRTNEIGIRMALGAGQSRLRSHVLGKGLWVILPGIAFGIAGAFASGRIVTALLFEVEPTDPLVFVVVPLFLTTISLLACYVPARRASRMDPMIALRAE